jgi:hypothetical protein
MLFDFAQAIVLLSSPFGRHALEKGAIYLPIELVHIHAFAGTARHSHQHAWRLSRRDQRGGLFRGAGALGALGRGEGRL